MSKGLIKFVAAGLIYAGFSVYLYQPYLEHFNRWDYLLPLNALVACCGCYVLSRRWVASFAGSFFAGAMYGFGPFMLGLGYYHPTAGLLAAGIPWLFLPAARLGKTKNSWLAAAFAVLPFLAIALFFQIAGYLRVFPISARAKLHPADAAALLAPLVMVKRNMSLVGFYHVPLAMLFIGFALLLKGRRIGVLIIIVLGTALATTDSFGGVSPSAAAAWRDWPLRQQPRRDMRTENGCSPMPSLWRYWR